jgi:hypothetical protein
MSRFLTNFITIVTNIDINRGSDSFITSRIDVFNNRDLKWYVDTLPSQGIVSIDIYFSLIRVIEGVDSTTRTLIVPDLTRFTSLERVSIDFPGRVTTVDGSGQLTLPNRVWMFALRNARLCSGLKFGTPTQSLIAVRIILTRRFRIPSSIADIICSFWGERFHSHPNPHAVIALQDAELTQAVTWQTIRGNNKRDMSLMILANKTFELGPIDTDDRLISDTIRKLLRPWSPRSDRAKNPEDYEVSAYVDTNGSEGESAISYQTYEQYHADSSFDIMLYGDYRYEPTVLEWSFSNLAKYTDSISSPFHPEMQLSMFLDGFPLL